MISFEGEPTAAGGRFLIAAAKFNRWITDRLVEGAKRELVRLGANEADIDVAWVPGSFELPAAVKAGAASGRYAAVVCVGAVIKGETSHDEHISAACANGIREVSTATGVPAGASVPESWRKTKSNRSSAPTPNRLKRSD